MTRTLGILGPGVLGLSTAQWAAQCGLDVRLLGRDQAHAEQGLQELQRRWMDSERKGRIAPSEAREALGRVQAQALAPEALDGLEALLEALPEDPALKARLLSDASKGAPPDLLWLTGTSSLPVADLATASGLTGRLLGFHLFVPVPRMHVVELVVPAGVPGQLVARAESLALALRKKVAQVRDQPGFAAARMGLAQGLEAMRLLEAGVATAEDLDLLMVHGYGHPVGPLELSDRVGLELRLRIAEGLYQATGEARYRPPDILRDKVARGETGLRVGRGFHTWDRSGRRT